MNEKSKIHLERKFAQMSEAVVYGTKKHIFENNTQGELFLPRPSENGKVSLLPKEQFVGDDYYMNLVKKGDLKHISTLNEQLLTEIPPAVRANTKEVSHQTEQLLTETPTDGITLI